jgi:hypothetical protein
MPHATRSHGLPLPLTPIRPARRGRAMILKKIFQIRTRCPTLLRPLTKIQRASRRTNIRLARIMRRIIVRTRTGTSRRQGRRRTIGRISSCRSIRRSAKRVPRRRVITGSSIEPWRQVRRATIIRRRVETMMRSCSRRARTTGCRGVE